MNSPFFCDLVGHEIAKEILRPVLFGNLFLPPLKPVCSAIVKFGVSLAQSDPDDDTQSITVLRGLFNPSGEALPLDAAEFHASPFAEDLSGIDKSEQALAQHIGRILGAIARSALSIAVSDAADRDTTQASAAGTSLSAVDSFKKAIEQFVRELGLDEEVIEGLKESGVLQAAEAAERTGGRSTATGTPEDVINFLRALAGYLANLCPQLAFLPGAIVDEMASTAARAALAYSLELTASRIPLYLRSNLRIGNRVHRLVQQRYVGTHSHNADVVTEAWIPAQQFVDQVVTGPTTGGRRVSLTELAASPARDVDWFFRCLRASSASARIDKETWLRADLADRRKLEVWEIKPVGNSVNGVWQEAVYRNGFNLVRALLDCKRVTPLTGPLRPGSNIIVSDTLQRGIGSRSYSIFNPIDVTYEAGMPAVAVPFQVVVLEGLLPYIVFRGPHVEELSAVLTVFIAKLIADSMTELQAQQWAEGAVAFAREVLNPIAEALTAENILAAILVLLLVILVLVACITPGLQPLAPAALGFALLIGFSVSMEPMPTSGGTIAIRFTPVSPDAKRRARGNQGRPGVTDVYFAGISLKSFPVDAVNPLLMHVGRNFDRSLGQIASFLKQYQERREADTADEGQV